MADDILVVDDNELNRRLLEFILTSGGYTVRSASNATDALAAIQSALPRLILMDIQLPGMSGLDLTRQLRADPATRGIAIIAVTAFAMKGDQEKALAAGCDAYVTKPIDKDLLRTLVKKHTCT
jgi:CheY-like chemotaxis protein